MNAGDRATVEAEQREKDAQIADGWATERERIADRNHAPEDAPIRVEAARIRSMAAAIRAGGAS